MVEGDVWGPDLELGDQRLSGADPLAELLLREAAGLAFTPNSESHGQPQLDELSLFSGESEKIRRVVHCRTCRILWLRVSPGRVSRGVSGLAEVAASMQNSSNFYTALNRPKKDHIRPGRHAPAVC